MVRARVVSVSYVVLVLRVSQGHIHRAGLCDLALDSPMYNAGATAADTLFAGVPIISYPHIKVGIA